MGSPDTAGAAPARGGAGRGDLFRRAARVDAAGRVDPVEGALRCCARSRAGRPPEPQCGAVARAMGRERCPTPASRPSCSLLWMPTSRLARCCAFNSAKIGGSILLALIGNAILVPVVLFYLLLDWPRLVEARTQSVSAAGSKAQVEAFAGVRQRARSVPARGQLAGDADPRRVLQHRPGAVPLRPGAAGGCSPGWRFFHPCPVSA